CGTLPENAILSHDLLEGSHARAGLLSDIELYEDYPSRYPADVSRRQRWIRGDWQIAQWLLSRVPALGGQAVPNPISTLSKWKIFDNLRRSLMPTAMLALLLGAWLFVPRLATAADILVLATLAAAWLVANLVGLVRKPSESSMATHLRVTAAGFGRHFAQILFTLVFLPYDTFTHADAILRTGYRMLYTKRRLLEWTTSSDAHRAAQADLPGFFAAMWIAPILAVVVTAVMVICRRNDPIAWPLLYLWLVSPVVGWWLSRRLKPPVTRLSSTQYAFIGRISRRTWRYFETFVTAQDHWLPPDNVQLHPTTIVAPRTSPTNIGMGLLADLSAYDFGYCSVGRLLDRTQKTFGTLDKLERYRGHFFNWYDTRTLKPLQPMYVSMVDSGNFAGHLLVLRQGFLELIRTPVLPARLVEGLRDTVGVFREAAQSVGDRGVITKLGQIEVQLAQSPRSLRSSFELLTKLSPLANEILATASSDDEVQWWAGALARSIGDHRDDLLQVAPWLALPAAPNSISPETRRKIDELLSRPDRSPSLIDIVEMRQRVSSLIDGTLSDEARDDGAISWLQQLRSSVNAAAQFASARIHLLERLAQECQDFAEMDFTFLYDHSRDLFSIGYNVADRRLDNSFYDLLASEARLGSFVAIALGQLGQQHWFALGRMLTTTGAAPALLSWSGSMFEFLMPLLVMPTYENTLLDQTYRAVVQRQIDYGKQRGVPWGISESGYNTTDQHLNYQYRAFGVPGLGLKRGLADDLVIAPYATAMAFMVAPELACRNLEKLAADGELSRYGFYEAIDYTPSRLPPGASSVIIKQFMAHHEGMSLLSFAYILLNQPMQRRFRADPMLRAADLLLQERVPKASTPVYPHAAEASARGVPSLEEEGTMRVFTDPGGASPEVHLLSNGQYHVMITSAGGGYSRWRDLAVTRWREDATRDSWGSFCYLRDVKSRAFWSSAWQPTLKPAKKYEAIFTQARAEFRRMDEDIESHTEISVSPEDDIELRRITLINRSEFPRTIEITSYSETVLASRAQDLAHPAFSNLFVQTELVRDRQAILCTRRPRSASERPPWMVHLMMARGSANGAGGATVGETSYETDRMKFIGRGRNAASPVVMDTVGPLSNTEGSVLDPVCSIRQTIVLRPGEPVRIDMVTGVAETREAATAVMDKYHDVRLADRVFELAWTHANVLLRQLNVTEASAQVFGRLAGSMVYATSLRRAKPAVLIRNRRGQSGLWGYGISGDLPIMLVRIRDISRIDLIRQAVQAHAYWRLKGLAVDLVIWNEDDSVYRQTSLDAIMDLIAAGPEAALVDKPGGLFIRRGEQMSEEDRALLQTVARVVLQDEAGTFAEQVERRGRGDLSIPALKPPKRRPSDATAIEPVPSAKVAERDLAFFNGVGGFSRDGREYIITVNPGQTTPAPWSNVIANPYFGTVISESGGAYTWSENSHELRLTPWFDDPITDASGEAFYIRDEESGRYWSPSPLLARGRTPYRIRHGFGYTIFEHEEDGIASELCLYVATDAPVKFSKIRLTNRSGRTRQISVTGYWEWVLGELRENSLMHVVTELDSITDTLLARNAYNTEFAGRVAFVDCSEPVRTVTADRYEFIGRNGTLAKPAALGRVRLSGRVGAGLDPCSAMHVPITIDSGQTKEIVFTLGMG
ncbi:MAG: cyclic beta 1-2 glucan synthetase, partial [Phycisphaerae bacterium]|nr:cyclic beta 1-2 glucan synthetase [Phycisphaerae bacterium]